jgi:hypothetical protein
VAGRMGRLPIIVFDGHYVGAAHAAMAEALVDGLCADQSFLRTESEWEPSIPASAPPGSGR